MYHWKWEFKGREVQENGRYKMLYGMDPPNSCAQSLGRTRLQITNISKQDLGNYKCAVLKSNLTLGEDDVFLKDMSKSRKCL